MEYYQLSAKQNNSHAQNGIGFLYKFGRGVKIDYILAKKYFELAAKQNNSNALYNLGYLYNNGYGVEKDVFKAKKYYELSANLDNSFGLNALGFLYETDKEIGIDYSKAFQCYEKAIKLNNTNALVNLGCLHRDGWGVPRDYLKAINLFESAGAKGNTEGYLYLGLMYDKGIGVEQNYIKAKEYYELAIKPQMDELDALHNLGNLYFYGKGVIKDYSKAKYYYEMSSKYKNHESLYMLGILYENGYGVEQSFLMAKDYYELASKYGNYSSYFNLARLFISGEFFKVDYPKAIQYLENCAQSEGERKYFETNGFYYYRYNYNFYPSKNELALIYLLENKDIELAKKYFKEAGEYPCALNNYGLMCQLYFNNLFKAKDNFKKASSKYNFVLSEFNLGHLIEREKSIEKAIKHYINASNHENDPIIFQDQEIKDKQLNFSKSFIVILANLKIAYYYLTNGKEYESNDYFIKIFDTLKQFQKYIPSQTDNEYNIFTVISRLTLFLQFLKGNILKTTNKHQRNEKEGQINIKNTFYKKEFSYEGKKFDSNIKDVINQKLLNENISEIIKMIEEILFTPPYLILFGRAQIQKPKHVQKKIKSLFIKPINKLFYEGLDINI